MAPLRNVGRLRAPIFADCRAFGRDFIGFIGRRDEYEGHRSSTGDRAEHDARGIAPPGPRYVGVEGTAARHPNLWSESNQDPRRRVRIISALGGQIIDVCKPGARTVDGTAEVPLETWVAVATRTC